MIVSACYGWLGIFFFFFFLFSPLPARITKVLHGLLFDRYRTVVIPVYEREMGKVRVEVTLGLLLAFAWLWSLFSDLFHGFGFAKYTTSLLE